MVEVALTPRTPLGKIGEWQRGLDWPLLLAAVSLLAVGMVLSLAAGPPAAERYDRENAYFFVQRHAVFAVAAMIVLFVTSLLNRDWVRRISALILIVSLVLLAVILVIGEETQGSRRWLRIESFSLQPSEVLKPALVVITGWLLAQRRLFPEGPWAAITLVFFVTSLGFLLMQPDVGQAALLSAAFVITFFVSGLPLRWAVIFAGGGAALASALYAIFPHVRYRVNSFINPTDYDTYQLDKAREAISRGGLLGVGPGEGQVKPSLPDAHTDFIYAVLGEEFGYVAMLGLVLLFAFIIWRGFRAAARIHDPYPRAAAAGLFALFGLQAAINIAVNISLIPPKGMTLPFISYGGSSMIGTALTLGMAMALIRRGSETWRA